MAGTGLGLFLPSETAYKDPGKFRDTLEAEGNKEATYLAQMDQFFAQLEESQRQFDVTTEQKQEFFEEGLAWEKEKSADELAFARWAKEQDVELGERGQDVQRYGIRAQRDVGMAGVAADRERTAMNRELGNRQLDEREDVNDFYQGLYRTEEVRRQETHDVAKKGIASLNGGGSADRERTVGSYDYGDIYASRNSEGALSFSDSPTREDGRDDWYNADDWKDTLW